MMQRIFAVLLGLSMLSFAFAPVNASNVQGDDNEIIVAVLDTGIRATHEEFEYTGDGTGPGGQIVAWWDFTSEKVEEHLPGEGDLWDPEVQPYDSNGHGTMTASRVGGKTSSLNPGVKLAIAKVGDSEGSVNTLTAAHAYDWAINVVGADVVSMSFGLPAPIAPIESVEDAFVEGRAKGVVNVVSGGNGGGVGCGPDFSWSGAFGYSRNAIAVGNLGEGGGAHFIVTCSSFDPDVAAAGINVRMACPDSDDCYDRASGTSFSAPYVAGAVARYVEEAAANGHFPITDYYRDLVMSCAIDTIWPHTIEGAGFFSPEAFERGIPHAQAGTLCPYQASGPAWETMRDHNDVAKTYKEYAQIAYSELMDFGAQTLVPVAPANTGEGLFAPGGPAGASEVEVYALDLKRGDTVPVSVTWDVDNVTDLDVYVLAAEDYNPDAIRVDRHIAFSANNASETESLEFTAAWDGTYYVVVFGWLVEDFTPVTVNTPGATFDGESVFVGQTYA